MDLKSIGTKAFIAAAILAGSALITLPAQAFTIKAGDLIINAGRARFNAPADGVGSFKLNFRDGNTNLYATSTGRASVADADDEDLIGTNNVVLQDLTFVSVGVNKWLSGPKASFFSINSGAVKFDLTEFILTFDPNSAEDGWLGQLTGNLTSENSLPAIGEFDPVNDIAFTRNEGSAYAYTTTAIPTPALIPGLVGLGVAALRKRKYEASEQAEA